jgi:kinesin family protein 18/19
LIEGVINGYNATVFAYGATNAGKTYTMLGTEGNPGIMVNSLNEIFEYVDSLSRDKEF